LTSNKEIDLFSELIANYEGLFPNQLEVLVVFYLYQKKNLNILEDSFSHDTIVQSIDQVSLSIGKETNSNHNLLIRKLRKFFLRKTKDGYSLKEFAIDFCTLIQTEISNQFNPTQLELKFKALAQSLEINLSNEGNFQLWYSDFFLKNKLDIRKQIDILHDKLEVAIMKLNSYYSSYDTSFAQRLGEMDSIVKEIQMNTNQLTKAFDAKEEIRDLLNKAKNNVDSFAYESDFFITSRVDVINFLESSEQALSDISLTIDSIIPQMDRLFASLEHREFDRKLETMLTILFSESTLTKVDKNWSEVKLPIFISLIQIAIKKPRLTYCEDYHYLDVNENKALRVNRDLEEEESNYNQSAYKFLVNRKAHSYSSSLISLLKTGQSISLSSHFNSILAKEDLEVAFKSIFLTLKEASKDQDLVIKNDTSIDFNSLNPNIATWKTEIKTTSNS
tara:strand:- start:608 stop:1948 length:1341 start_codon:yes stop_codon:yes gene_type:complete